MIRTFGIGPRVKKSVFSGVWDGTFGRTRRQFLGKKKNNALGNMTVFWAVLGSIVDRIVPKRSPGFDNFPMFLRFFHAIFIMLLASETQQQTAHNTHSTQQQTAHNTHNTTQHTTAQHNTSQHATARPSYVVFLMIHDKLLLILATRLSSV